MAGDLVGRPQQDRPEHVQHDRKPLDQRHAGEDESRPQNERAEHAPEQDSELVLRGNGEEREDDGPHEDVVDAQAQFEDVAGPVLTGRLRSVPRQHDRAEGQPEGDPHRTLDGRFLDRYGVRLAVQYEKIDEEQYGHDRDEAAPLPRGDVEAGEPVGVVGRRGRGRRDQRELASTACAAARRAIGTRNGEQDT